MAEAEIGPTATINTYYGPSHFHPLKTMNLLGNDKEYWVSHISSQEYIDTIIPSHVYHSQTQHQPGGL